jgi:GGDEF domain-containing protein
VIGAREHEARFWAKVSEGIPVSISVGAAVIQDFEVAEELLARADQLMYRIKLSGRGCAALAGVG